MAASLLNSPATIQFSNWPIADGYISSLNIPAPPSAYPKTSTAFSANGKSIGSNSINEKDRQKDTVIRSAASLTEQASYKNSDLISNRFFPIVLQFPIIILV